MPKSKITWVTGGPEHTIPEHAYVTLHLGDNALTVWIDSPDCFGVSLYRGEEFDAENSNIILVDANE